VLSAGKKRDMTNKLKVLQEVVPEIVASTQQLLKASNRDAFDAARQLLDLLWRLRNAYPEEIVKAAELVAIIRFSRWAKDYRRAVQIKEMLNES
jgi:hypothetical protein